MAVFSSLIVPILIIIMQASYVEGKGDIPPKGTHTLPKDVKTVLKDNASYLMAIPGVVGAGEGVCEGRPCIKVFVTQDTPELDRKIPKRLEGYQVVVEETGPIKALPK
jgi:hypothetical protein